MSATVWIVIACVVAVAAFPAAAIYATRDTGDRAAGPAWRLPRLHWPRRRRPLTWARQAIRARLARIPPAENPDPSQEPDLILTADRPLTATHMNAIRQAGGERPWAYETGEWPQIMLGKDGK